MLSKSCLQFSVSSVLLSVFVTLCLAKQAPLNSSTLQPHVIFEYPKDTWLENLVIRQEDGNALVTILSAPQVQLISTTNSTAPVLVAEIPKATGCLGIVELAHNLFYVVAGNWSTVTETSTPGSYSIWQLDLRNRSAQNALLSKTADLPNSGFLNGLTVANPVEGILLAADSGNGLVWSVNVHTGAVAVAINDTTMSPIPDAAPPLGINAVSVKDQYLYYDNSNRATFNRIPIDVLTGKATGPAETLLQSNSSTVSPDDFAFDFAGNAWLTADLLGELDLLAGAGNQTIRPQGLDVEVVAGSPAEQNIAGWTAAKFGTKAEDVRRGSLYVTTNGGPRNYIYGNWTAGGMLVRLDTAELGIYGGN